MNQINQLISQLHNSNFTVARDAVKNLVLLQNQEATNALLKELESPLIGHWLVDAVAWAFSEIHDQTVIEPLIHLIEKRGYSYPAVKTLQELGDSRAVLPLFHLLQKTEIPGIATALGRLGCPEAVDLLLPLVEHSNPEMRYYVVRALGMLQDKSVLPILEQVKLTDTTIFQSPKGLKGTSVSNAAKEAISRIQSQDE